MKSTNNKQYKLIFALFITILISIIIYNNSIQIIDDFTDVLIILSLHEHQIDSLIKNQENDIFIDELILSMTHRLENKKFDEFKNYSFELINIKRFLVNNKLLSNSYIEDIEASLSQITTQVKRPFNTGVKFIDKIITDYTIQIPDESYKIINNFNK